MITGGGRMEIDNSFTCQLIIPHKYYIQLSEEGKKLYEEDRLGMKVALPMKLKDGITLADCIPAFIETVYLELNPKYRVTEDTLVRCELYKLGKTDEVFNLMISITYPESEKEFHELLIFHQVELSERLFCFELMGDQTMFQINY